LLRLIGGPSRFAAAAAYAWNPLVVYSFVGAAHFDSLMLWPLVAGVLLLVRFEAAQSGRDKWLLATGVAALFGVAISIKLIPVLLLPLCVFALRSRAPALALSVAIPALLSTFYGWPQVPIWDSLRRFAYVTRLNDLFWWIVEESVWPNPRQKNYHYNVVIVIVVVVLSVIFWRNWRRGMLWVIGAALILTPVLHPWYCTWILPFATWRRVSAWHVLSISLFSYYLFWNERLFALPWHAELWMRALITLPPVIALLLAGRAKLRPA
jgi:alpha-1,6-mannosyltransferase